MLASVCPCHLESPVLSLPSLLECRCGHYSVMNEKQNRCSVLLKWPVDGRAADVLDDRTVQLEVAHDYLNGQWQLPDFVVVCHWLHCFRCFLFEGKRDETRSRAKETTFVSLRFR